MPSRARSSEGRGSLIVIEGMPGAGKTSAAAVLERRGHQVVGEYVSERPGVEDDERAPAELDHESGDHSPGDDIGQRLL
ncbi:MAG TPA: hypothetical protein VGO86_08280 [Candidatus Dormibacteraeota bacterium]